MGHILQRKNAPQGLLLAHPSQHHHPIFELVPKLPIYQSALNICCALHSPAVGRESILNMTQWKLKLFCFPLEYLFLHG